MILRNLQLCGQEGMYNIRIENERILDIKERGAAESVSDIGQSIEFEEAIAFPGLINSHDHLEFNLFERLGGRLYPNYVEWAKHLQKSFGEKIGEITRIPLQLRVAWGIYKNLLNGITTVVNHGIPLKIDEPIIDVLQPSDSLHSIRMEKNWLWKINRPSFKKKLFAIHVGEGTDKDSNLEIDKLIRSNIFRKTLIGIHGVAMTSKQAQKFKALVWCPASNHFLLGQTAPIDQLISYTKIVFGTDSTLTADWNAWTHIREARSTGMATDQELFNMLTLTPASVWNLPDSGALDPGKKASIVVAKAKKNNSTWDSFYSVNPEDILLIIHRGSVKLFDESLKKQLENSGHFPAHFGRVLLGNSSKYVPNSLIDLERCIKKIVANAPLPFTV